jgi:putative transposase
MPMPGIDDRFVLSDDQWSRIEPLLPVVPPSPLGGKPRENDRLMMNAIYYVLRTGMQWKALPRELGAPSTVHDRFCEWRAAGVFEALWVQALSEFDQRVGIDWSWQAMDGVMTKAPLGGEKNGTQPNRQSQKRDEAQPSDGRTWRARGRGGGSRQQTRQQARRRNA